MSYTPYSLITLPRVDTDGAIALASALESAAEPFAPHTGLVLSGLDDIKARRIEAQNARESGDPLGTPTIKAIDALEDLGIGVLAKGTKLFAQLADHTPEGKIAAELDARLFNDGLDYVNYKVEQEWAVVEAKLQVIQNENLEPKFAQIGLGHALSFLKQTHLKYGEVIGVTKAGVESLALGTARKALMDAIRVYVVRVMATEEAQKPETQARVQAMLKPLDDWRVNKSSPKKPAPPDAPPAPPQP